MKKLAILLLSSWLAIANARAVNYYVDASPTGCSSAPCSDTNIGTTEALAFATPQGCINHVNAGDTCYIKNGTYVGAGTSSYLPKWNFCRKDDGSPAHVGTPIAKITYAAYPGHSPIFCQDALCLPAGANPRPTLGFYPAFSGGYVICENIILDHLTVVGQFYARGESGQSVRNIEIKNCDFSGGGSCDGNYTNFWLQEVMNMWVHHNYSHDMVIEAGCAQYNSSAYYKIFNDNGGLYEYNTAATGASSYTADHPLQFKKPPIGSIVRYNRFLVGNLRIGGGADNGTVNAPTNLQIYGNVLHNFFFEGTVCTTTGSGCSIGSPSTDVSVVSNTMLYAGSGTGVGNAGAEFYRNPMTPLYNLEFRDNLLVGTGDSFEFEYYNWVAIPTWQMRNNVYEPSAQFKAYTNGTTTIPVACGGHDCATLTLWKAALTEAGCSSCETNSAEATCNFVDTTRYRIDAGSPAACLTGSSTGGNVGAYSIATCTGHLCPQYAPTAIMELPTPTTARVTYTTTVTTETSYRIERKPHNGSTWTFLSNDAASPYDDTPGIGTWDYRVAGNNAEGWGSYSPIVTIPIGSVVTKGISSHGIRIGQIIN